MRRSKFELLGSGNEHWPVDDSAGADPRSERAKHTLLENSHPPPDNSGKLQSTAQTKHQIPFALKPWGRRS